MLTTAKPPPCEAATRQLFQLPAFSVRSKRSFSTLRVGEKTPYQAVFLNFDDIILTISN